MSYTLVRGRFYVVGYKPDGDSIRFQADSLQDWAPVGNVQYNNRQHVQLRLQGIDTLEVHANGNQYHQPWEKACEARNRLLALLNITNVQYSTVNEMTVTAANDGVRGTLLVRGLTFRRPISFLFAGDRFGNANSGSPYNATVAQICTSANAALLQEGQAYPLYYSTLDVGVRNAFTNLAIQAFNAPRGLWPYDWSENFQVRNLDDIQWYYCIFPKVFRRLLVHLRNHSSGAGFVQALANGQAGENDRLELATNPGVTIHLADVLRQVGNQTGIRMTEYPENLIFD